MDVTPEQLLALEHALAAVPAGTPGRFALARLLAGFPPDGDDADWLAAVGTVFQASPDALPAVAARPHVQGQGRT